MIKFAFVQGITLVAVVLVGCGGGDSSTGGGGEKTQQGSEAAKTPAPAATMMTADPTTPTSAPASCAVAGDKGNELGVGQYCAKGSGSCPSALFCTADFAAAEGEEFCTAFCSTDADCGKAATCLHDPRGSACVPSKCLAK